MGARATVAALALGASVPVAGVAMADPAVCDSTAGRLAVAAHTAGLPADKIPTAVAVALAESGGDNAAVGDTAIVDSKWGPSVGGWQVRSLHAERGTGGVRDELALPDLAHNARSMVAISSAGANWQPWSVYTNGRYLTHLSEGKRVANCTGTVTAADTRYSARPDAFELVNRAATNVIYGVGDTACPPSSSVELCARWRTFTSQLPTPTAAAPTAGMVTVEGMTVAAEAAPSLRRMLAAARSDGIELRAVSSLRSSDEQWALRVQNCPDPADSPPADCSPPTAKVGTSEHETGHAVDFASDGWAWLAANAERFGWSTHTVPGEPWHASFLGSP